MFCSVYWVNSISGNTVISCLITGSLVPKLSFNQESRSIFLFHRHICSRKQQVRKKDWTERKEPKLRFKHISKTVSNRPRRAAPGRDHGAMRKRGHWKGSYLHSNTCRQAKSGTNSPGLPVQSDIHLKLLSKTGNSWIDFLILFDNAQLATHIHPQSTRSTEDINAGLYNSTSTSVCGACIRIRHFKPIFPKPRALRTTDKRGS